MVIYAIRKWWSHDMGLRLVGEQFQPVFVEDLEDAVLNDVPNVGEDQVGLRHFSSINTGSNCKNRTGGLDIEPLPAWR